MCKGYNNKTMLNKLERKIGRFAIPGLMKYLIGGYIIGYLLSYGSRLTGTNFIAMMTLEPFAILHRFQIYRLITWVLIPPADSLLFAIIMMILYYQLGNTLERTWGTFRFNVYIFGGIIFTLIGAFILYGVYRLLGYPPESIIGIGTYISTYYINMSIFLAFAACFPDMQVLLYFIIPVKMKWMAVFYAVIIGIEALFGSWPIRVVIISSLLNFVVFWLSTRNLSRINPSEVKRKYDFKKAYNAGANAAAKHSDGTVAKHRCAICGRTNITNPELDFRFCSKCNGNFEYCNDHLFTHQHVQ